MNTLLSLISALALISVSYCVYQRKRVKNSHKQTRVVLREQFTDEQRNQRMIDAVKQSCEWDVTPYTDEEER